MFNQAVGKLTTCSKEEIHSGNAADDSNITGTVTVKFQVWQKPPTVCQVNSRTFLRNFKNLGHFKQLQGLQIATAKFDDFQG